MAEEALISRSEVEAMLFSIHDISTYIKRLVGMLEEEDGGEEEEDH